MSQKVDEFFPLKTVKIFNNDREWMTEEVQALRRQKSREYRKNGKSQKYTMLHHKFLQLKTKNSKKYIQKEVEALRTTDPRKFYQRIKKIGDRLGENKMNNFIVPKYEEQNLNPKECANLIAQHFSSISQEYTPIKVDLLPDRVKQKILSNQGNPPVIEPHKVYEKFKSRKFKLSSIPGDIPPKLKREFQVEIAGPVADIFNSITKSGEYPRQWVKEFVTPIPKVTNVESEDDLRNISLTADLSKDYENFIAE